MLVGEVFGQGFVEHGGSKARVVDALALVSFDQVVVPACANHVTGQRIDIYGHRRISPYGANPDGEGCYAVSLAGDRQRDGVGQRVGETNLAVNLDHTNGSNRVGFVILD